MCPGATGSKDEMKAFIGVSARLNSAAPGANLDPQDAHAIHFQIYEYAGVLEKFYFAGYALRISIVSTPLILCFVRYGGALAVQGVGYITELIGRLTNSPAHHSLQTNSTLELLFSPETFPLDRAMYVDFSHDNLIDDVFTAMDLFNQTDGPLDTTKITKGRTWIVPEMVPFSGHMNVEKLSCPARPLSLVATRSRPMRWWNWVTEDDREDKDEYVGIFVNDARQPSEFCGAGKDDICRLDEFVKSQEYARNDGFEDFERASTLEGESLVLSPYLHPLSIRTLALIQ